MTAMPSALRSSQQMRDVNLSAVLEHIWDAPHGAALTASEIIDRTGLTRATVLAICSVLRDSGWVVEDRAPSASSGRGRQARRFALDAQRHLVVAVDLGLNSITCVIADLRGSVLARVRHRSESSLSTGERGGLLMRVVEEALASAGVDASRVETACVGVAASVDAQGLPVPGGKLWELIGADLAGLRATPWNVVVENDANLAAVAEFAQLSEEPPASLVALLASDRFGAGIIVGGELLRGAHGAAGEMAYLMHVKGADNPQGLSVTARMLVDEARAAGRATVLQDRRPGAEETVVQDVLVAADQGDEVAVEIREKVVQLLTVTISTFSHFLDPARVVISGGIATVVAPLLPEVRARLDELFPYAPGLDASELGRDVVLVGAVHRAIQRIRALALT